jgi:release factor glutamine methyltransferase
VPPILSDDQFAALIAELRGAGCVFAEDEAALLREAAVDRDDLAALTARRVAGEPLEQVLGWAEFAGRRVRVAPGVFVPRRRSELVVREAVAAGGSTVVDLCCGTGAIGLAVALALPGSRLWSCDLDPAAVACAARNLADAGVDGRALAGDLDAPLPPALAGRVDVLTANTPYVPTAEIALMPTEARDHEPALALDGGEDGLALHRRVARAAPRWLRPGGTLVIETSPRQAERTAAACAAAGLHPRVVGDDELGATAVVALRP